ncbi:MAG: hypothetical protein LUF92_03825 [Clostridiales bacterium]|nr:hypothetical protein [Clostridiales bacterium]
MCYYEHTWAEGEDYAEKKTEYFRADATGIIVDDGFDTINVDLDDDC